MTYLRYFLLASAAGVGGCLYNVKTQKSDSSSKNKDHAKTYLRAFYWNISDYFYKSIIQKYSLNVLPGRHLNPAADITANSLICLFNIEDETEEDNEDVDEDVNDQPEQMYGEEVKVVPATAPEEVPVEAGENKARLSVHPTIATRVVILYSDYSIYCDTQTRTRWWAHQHITRCNVAESEHRHCEALHVVYNWPPTPCEQRPDVNSLIPPRHHLEGDQVVCHHCQHSNFWPLFHEYVTFLTERYDTVSVYSGVIVAPPEPPPEEYDERDCSILDDDPTHVFKVIMCKNADGTSRVECYKINYKQNPDEWMGLRNHLVSREELQADTGILFHENIPKEQIKDNVTHPDFEEQ